MRLATSFTSLAPMFSNGSKSSISFETVTPSFVTVGPLIDFWKITFRPLGPSVTFTARASLVTPSWIFRRVSSSKRICFAMRVRPLSAELREDLALAHDLVFRALDLDVGARVLAVHDRVALLHVRRDPLAVLAEPARADRDDASLLRLLLRGLRKDDAALRLRLGGERLHHDAVVQR